MSGCGPDVPPTEPTNLPRLPAPGETVLVVDSQQPMIRTARQETDALGAMRRGLREYLAGLSKVVAGELVQFVDVFEEWATSEDQEVRYPSAAILLADGTVSYDPSAFAPRSYPDDQLPDGRYVIKLSEATTEFTIEAHCSTPGSRLAVSMMLEEALNPVDWQYGFMLDLPHYFGQRAQFSLLSASLADDAETARHGLRPLRARLAGQISVVRPRALVPFKPKTVVTVIDSGSL